MTDKKITAQKRLKIIKHNTILETLNKTDTSYKKFTYHLWDKKILRKYSTVSTSLWYPLINVTSKSGLNAYYKDKETPSKIKNLQK